jgi:electron transfer flavoprotein beta subunit
VNPTDSYVIAKEISAYAADKGFDMVLLGKETISYNGSEVGGMLAEFMNLPYISLASSLEVNGDSATMDRTIEGGVEVVEVKMPFVASASKGMAEQRIPNMRGIMAARTKPLTVVAASGVEAKTAYVKYGLPDAKSAVTLVDAENMDELVNLLHTEAKVI